jgi:hypothetical protein
MESYLHNKGGELLVPITGQRLDNSRISHHNCRSKSSFTSEQMFTLLVKQMDVGLFLSQLLPSVMLLFLDNIP